MSWPWPTCYRCDTERHLRDQPECVEHGFLALFEGAVAQFRGEVDEAASKAERATELGQRFGDRDLIAVRIHLQGLARISAGGVAEGMALLDEAMTSVVAGELNPYFTGVIYCNVLSICLELADLARAAEWNKAATAWCESLPEDAPFPGLCRLNRIEAANLRGAWSDAESEARRASEELTFNPRAAGHAFYETGEIRRRIGNFAGAEEAFTRAHELGFDPQPGLALLRLAQGKAEAALGALRLAVAGASGSRLRRTRLLAAQVEVALPGGLTAREVEVLHLVATGKTNREVAAALTVSEHTVARHLQNIFAKLDVSSRAAATAFAVERGLA